MASVVGRALVENGQTRILQRLYDGITSNWVLDVADDKGSINHQLIHLVWRKFPRNQHSTEERRPTVSTQTEEGSDASWGLGTSAGLTGLPRGTDLGHGLYGPDDSASIPGTGSSGQSYSTNESMAQEKTNFMFPAKRRQGKPLNPEKKFQTHLSNRFDCLEEVSSDEKSYEILGKSTIGSQGNRSRRPSKTEIKSEISETPKTSISKSREIPTMSEKPTTSMVAVTDTSGTFQPSVTEKPVDDIPNSSGSNNTILSSRMSDDGVKGIVQPALSDVELLEKNILSLKTLMETVARRYANEPP